MRTKKAIKNIVFSALYQIVAIVCGLITPRLILAAFGSTYNGVVSSATQFLSFISILTLGIAGATRLALYKTLASNDVIGTSRIMKANRRYMRKVALCIVAYAVILSFIYPYISHNDLTAYESRLIILIVSIGTFADYFFGISNTTLLSADQSGYIGSIASIIKTVVNTIVTAVLIKAGCSIFIVKLGSSIVFLIVPIIVSIIIKSKYHLISNCDPDPHALDGRKAVAFHSIANIIHEDTDLLVLTVFADAKIISVYTVYNLVVGKLKWIVSIFTNGMESAFGNMWVKGETEALNKNFNTFEFFLYSFTSVVFSCVWVLLIPFVEVYTKGINDVNYVLPTLAILFTITEGFRVIRTPYLILVQATGFYEETKIGAMLEAVINLGSSIILVNFIGIYGVVIGTLIANVFRTVQYALFIYRNIIRRSLSVAIYRFIWLILTMTVIIFASKIAISFITFCYTWTSWFFYACVTFFISLVITFASAGIFYRADLSYLFYKAFSVIKKKK